MNLGKESETLEFKESTSELHQAIESIAAMLNKNQYGEILFGVYDNGGVKGQIISDATIKTVSDGISRDIEPRIVPAVNVLRLDGKEILSVRFSGEETPYSSFGKFLIRVGTQNRQMTRYELRKLIEDQDYSFPWEKEVCDLSLEDIDDETLKEYFLEAKSCGRLAMDSYDKEALLTALDLYKNGKLVNAATALFGKEGKIGLKLACYATNEKLTFTDLKSLKGNVYSLIKEAETYVFNHINWKAEINIKREEVPEIPTQAIREIAVNAFAHAMYDPLPEIEIDIHPSFVTIFNPGTFPTDLTPKDYVEQNVASIKRNPLILDVLYRCKDVEKSGTGFKRMAKECKERGVEWKTKQTPHGFYFTFQRKANGKPDDWSSEAEKAYVEQELTKLEKAILLLIEGDPEISRQEMAVETGKSISTIQRTTNSLAAKGRLARIGANRFGHWEIMR